MFELSKEHEDFRKVVREFAAAEVEPHIAKWDREPFRSLPPLQRYIYLALYLGQYWVPVPGVSL